MATSVAKGPWSAQAARISFQSNFAAKKFTKTEFKATITKKMFCRLNWGPPEIDFWLRSWSWPAWSSNTQKLKIPNTFTNSKFYILWFEVLIKIRTGILSNMCVNTMRKTPELSKPDNFDQMSFRFRNR